jgi:hypothetical protein
VKVATGHMMALCAALEGNGEAFERMTACADEEHLAPLSALLTATFFSAARMRFAAGSSVTGVIRFVPDADSAWAEPGLRIQPSLTEALLLSVLAGTPVASASDEAAKAYPQAALLRALADDLGEQNLYALLDHVREQADGWLAQV